METMNFDELLAQAEKDRPWEKIDPDELMEAQIEQFALSESYVKNMELLVNLVNPLMDAFPNELEYQHYARAHEGLEAGPGTAPHQAPKRSACKQMLHTINPAWVFMTEVRRNSPNEKEPFPYLSDQEYDQIMTAVETMDGWWEHNSSVNALELAKSVILHAVLSNSELRAKALLAASKEIKQVLDGAWILDDWRDTL